MKNYSKYSQLNFSVPLVLVFLILFFIPVNLYSFFNSDVNKAKDFIKVNMFDQAITLLNKRILDKPIDEEAHYLLGVCYLNKEQFDIAEKRFISAATLDKDIKNQIADKYKEIGKKYLNKGIHSHAYSLFQKSIEYNKGNRTQIALMLRNIAKELIDTENLNNSKLIVKMAVNINMAEKNVLNKFIIEKANKLTIENAIEYYNYAYDLCYNCQNNNLAGNRLLDYANKIEAKKGLTNAEVKHLRIIASKLLNKTIETNLQVYFQNAWNLRRKKKYDEAIKSLLRIVSINPLYSEAYNVIAYCYEDKKEFINAEKYFKQACKVDNKNCSSLAYFYATCTDKRCKNPKAAIELATKDIELQTNFQWFDYEIIAAAYSELKNFTQAITNQELAIKCLLIDKDESTLQWRDSKVKKYQKYIGYYEQNISRSNFKQEKNK